MICCDSIPPIQVECREIPERVKRLRVYRRFPRKMKKRFKKQESQRFHIHQAQMFSKMVEDLVLDAWTRNAHSPNIFISRYKAI